MTEDEIKAWFFKYGQYANGRDMALIKAIEAAIKPQRTWVGLTEKDILEAAVKSQEGISPRNDTLRFATAIEAKLKEKNT